MIPEENLADVGKAARMRDEIDTREKADKFREKLSYIRASRLSFERQRRAVGDDISNLCATRDEIIAQFNDEARSRFPNVDSVSPFAEIKQHGKGHPFVDLYQKYHGKIVHAEREIARELVQFKSLKVQEIEATDDEGKVLQKYDDFRHASPIADELPDGPSLICDLPTNDVMSSDSYDLDVLAQVDALDLVDPNAAALIEKAMSLEPDSAVEGIQTPAPVVKPPGINPLWLGVGLAALAWVMMGGKD